MKDVLRKKVTLTGWMHNNKLLVVFSVLVAVILWAVVMTNSTTTRERQIAIPVTVDLTDSYASQQGLHLLDNVSENVTVTVKGPWSAISSLTPSDILVSADVSTVQKSGKQMVTLVPSRSGSKTDYEIVSCSPSQLEINCDYWETLTLPFEVNTSALKVADAKTMQLGAPVPSAGKEGTLSVTGPQTVVHSIAKLTVSPEAEEPLSETRNFSPELKAVTKKGEAVSLKNCTVDGLDSTTVSVTVPVDFYKTLKISVGFEQVPKAIRDDKDALKVNPKTVKVIGPKDALNAMSDELALSTVDFGHLTNQKYVWKFPITLPEAVTLLGDHSEAKVSIDLSGYSKKIIALPVSDKNVTFENNANALKTAVEKKTINITLYGEKASLDKLEAKDLKVSVDLGDGKDTGLKTFTGTVSASGVDDVWFYYGEAATGVPVYVTLS